MDNNTDIRGQIASIRLKNFMSYDDVTLYPGFHLNFIIGPNGTGKSTFVCAVIIGLGGKLKSLGRADHLSSFLKAGTKEGYIIVELYDPAEGNIRIKRVITKNNTSEFFVNESRATATKIAEIRDYYNIHLDNLCTFLPQEKVQDFSRLNPQELLYQTQNIAGDCSMADNYEQLKELRTSVLSKEKHVRSLMKQLDEKKQKNERIKEKVQMFIENKALCDRLTTIKQKKAWLAYAEEFVKYKYAEKDFQLVQEQFTEKQKEYEKYSNTCREMEKKIISLQENHLKAQKEYSAKELQIEAELTKFRKFVERLEGFNTIIEAKLSAEEEKKKELKQNQETLDKLRNDLLTFESKNGTENDLNRKLEEVQANIVSSIAEESDMSEKKVALEDELGQIKTDIQNTSMEFRILEKRRKFRLEYLKRYEPDVYKSVEWLKEHGQMFRGRIYNPMLLELDVTDVKYAKYIEARVPYRDLIAFTCTNVDDMNLLIRKLRTEQGLRVNAVCVEDSNETYEPDFPMEQIRSLGFYAYVKDLLTGPDHIIQYLCKVYKIHKVPIGDESVEMNCDTTPDGMRVFFSEKRMFSIKYSQYSGEKSITVKSLNEPKFFNVPLDNDKIKQIIEREKMLITQREEKEMKLKLATHFLKNIADAQEELRREKRNIATLQSEKEQILFKINRAELKVAQSQNALKDPFVIHKEMEKERQHLRTEILACLTRLRKMFEEIAKFKSDMQYYELACKIEREKLYGLLDEKDNSFNAVCDLEEKLNSLKATKEGMKDSYKQLEQEARNLTEGFGPHDEGFEKFQKVFRTLQNNMEELDREIQEIQVTSEFMRGGDTEMLQEYEQREQEISALNNELIKATAALQQTRESLTSLRESWVVPVTNLVSRINESFGEFFRNMNCTGVISLSRGEDENNVEEYGISIKVQFRSEVPLHDLGRHFQSGGERAITTAVYLLSLQTLMNAPFRFVDEINQGMDATNERRMIELMIKVTDNQNATQYFFITPKLLPNIPCSDTMVVHCIYSGQNAIPSSSWNLDSFLSRT